MEWCVASKGGWVALYSQSRGGDVSPPERSGNAANVGEKLQREGARCCVDSGACPRLRTRTGGGWGSRQAHARTLAFWTRRACACCGGYRVGKHQGAVKGDGSRLVVRCGSRQRALERAHVKQSARRQPERVETLPGAMSSRGHQAGMVKMMARSGQTLSTSSTVQCYV